ncbi:11894_t:CDS:10 [Racocetra fulgida]|uniref:aspartyl aminopeptidase n=1 Tax=Racocetra fulgida TaxID=60492 RepID=A0A9N9F7S0_9GLOM|nr:11894_t:CDS:10 [Racocetra fulgida]
MGESNVVPNEASDFIKFVNESPSPFHAVESARLRLRSAGYEEIKERGQYVPGNGISIIGAHTDSPCLKLKPVSKKASAGYLQVGVETYGDLSVAGRVMVENDKHQFEHKLIKVNSLTNGSDNSDKNDKNESFTPRHHPVLLDLLVKELGVKAVNQIHDFELCLYDTQPSTTGGVFNEFIFSARLDNLMMSYTALTALINSTNNVETLCDDKNIRLVVLFDNEEIGSKTAHGADSKLLETTIRRLTLSNISDTISQASVVVKINANQRYATTAATSLILREAAKKYKVPLQEFCVRADSPCGSTIGPMISANLGLRTVGNYN